MSDQNTLGILIAARELLSDEARWTRKAFARSGSGRVTDLTSTIAVCWCPLGAIYRIPSENNNWHYQAIKILRSVITMPIAEFNDDPATTHAMVLAALDRAIEKAKSA